VSTRASTRRSDPWPLPVRLERTWVPDPLAYPRPPHTERFPYPYHPTIPPAIADAELLLSGTVAKAVEDASRLLERLNTSADALHYELVAAPLLRSEAVSSSRIEGLRASHRTIAEALEGPGAAKATALAIANNVGAMQDAITMAEAGPLEVSTILDIHRRLVAHTQHEPLGGVTRQGAELDRALQPRTLRGHLCSPASR
jgi:Fic family protein